MKEKNTVSAAEMKEIERIADAKGLSYRQMMENAGTAAYEVMRERWSDARRIVIFVGKGNNGGDGFVIARLYASFLSREESGEGETIKGEKTPEEQCFRNNSPAGKVIVVLCEGEPVTEDAVYNLGLLRGSNTEVVTVMTREEYENAVQQTAEERADLLVDALYGTGFHGALRENGAAATALINASGIPVCALDLPSGVNADTGEVASGAVKADLTVAFHRRKHGHENPEAAPYCGEIVTVSIGIDEMEEKAKF